MFRKMDKKKKAVAIVLLVVIVIATIAIVKYYDVAFRQRIDITYPDGCKETYIRGELVTPSCIQSRLSIQMSDLEVADGDTEFIQD